MMIPPFYFREGPVANNVSELREVLQQLEPGQISQYVNYEKNDFANWAEHGLKDPELAEKLKAALEPTEVMNVLNNVLGYRGLPKRMFGTFNKLKGELNIFRRLPKLEERPRTIPTAPPMFDRGNNPDNEEISNEEIRGEHWEYIPPHNTGWEMDKGFYNEQASEGRMRFELDSDDEETELDRSIEQELSEIPGGYGSDKGVLQEDPGMLAPHKVYPHFENNEADGSKDEFVPPGHRPQQEEEYMPPGMAVETETAETEGMNPSEHGPKQYEPRRAGDMNKKDFKDRDLNDKMYAEQQAVSDFKPLKRLPSIKTTVTLAIFVIVSFVLGFIVRGFFVG